MGFHNTKYLVGNILDSLGGIPEECSWIDYKAGCEFDREFREGIKSLVVAFLNSIQAFDKDKYIIFGIFEDKSLKQISRGQPRNKRHNNQTILIGGFEN